MWSEELDITKILFEHLQRCHRVLISPKHVVRGASMFKVLFNTLEINGSPNLPKIGGLGN